MARAAGIAASARAAAFAGATEQAEIDRAEAAELVDSLPDIGMSIPITELVGFTVVAILAGLGAAIIPDRRASRLNVLEALHYE